MSALNTQVGGSHYQMPIQPMEFAMTQMYDFATSSILKYVSRHRQKNGRQDIEKALHIVELRAEIARKHDLPRLLDSVVAVRKVSGLANNAGWWTDLETGEDVRNWPKKHLDNWVSAKLMLIVTEVAEAMEGHRKGLKDDKIPHRGMLEVELADAVIRIMDLAGGLNMDVAGAIVEKLAYNMSREDHQIENRKAAGGKSV